MEDVRLKETGQGSDFIINDTLSDFEQSRGIENMPYLAWFSNQDTFWGNEFFPSDILQLNSTTQETIYTTSLGSRGVLLIEEAAINDLDFLSNDYNITVDAQIITNNRVQLTAVLKDETTQETFIVNGN